MKTIGIRVLGGDSIGYGHYYRCLSLAKGIDKYRKNIKIIFFINKDLSGLIKDTKFNYIVEEDLDKDNRLIEELDIDLFILDRYEANNRYLERVKKITRLMLIDDNNDIYDSRIPNILYNGNIHADKLNYKNVEGQTRLLGPKYLIMKEEYWENDNLKPAKNGTILITTGGSDHHRVAIEILRKIKESSSNIRLIIGPGYEDEYIKSLEKEAGAKVELIYKPTSLKKHIRESELVITAAGSTVYEILSQERFPIIFSIADNQDLICRQLKQRGIEYLGKYPNIDYDKLKDIIENKNELINNYQHINIADGKSMKRLIGKLGI